MQVFIGATLLSSTESQPQSKPFEISDSRLPGFILRIQPSGVRTYYARFGRNRRVVLGKVDSIAPEEARERCQKVLGNVAHGCHPLHGVGGTEGITLGMFIADTYTIWVNASRPRTAANTLEKLHRLFRTWYTEPLTAITVERIESWKARRLNHGRSPATVLRDLFTLSSVLRRAVKAGELTQNPVRRVDKPRIDRRGKVRFLDEAEESRLRAALKARDEELQNLRTSGNARRQYRHEKLRPLLPHFGDHLTAAVLLSMNTGLRRGEVLKLRWACVDFDRQLLTVEGRTAKNRQTRHVPLNEEAVSVLRRWREQSEAGARIFNMATGFRTAWEKLLRRARISQFRWHDLRHHFASRLAQRGVPLNTVRDLLGHSSIAMTLRYAYLAPDQRREAVAKLNEKPIFALTMRLPWSSEPAEVFYPIDFDNGKGGTRTLDPGIMRRLIALAFQLHGCYFFGMEALLRYRGRAVTPTDVRFINEVIAKHPGESRRQLSVRLCEAWEWKQPNGVPRDMVARGLMLALWRAGHIELPAIRQRPPNPLAMRVRPRATEVDRTPITVSLRELGPLSFRQVRRTHEEAAFNGLLESYHYLGYTQPVGEQLKFIVSSGTAPVALFAWSSAARHLGPRDRYLGWAPEVRRRNIRFLAYNTRYLILPWVHVEHLASHLLARMTRMLPAEWEKVYGHPVYFAETFVDTTRHRGTCYRAANWVFLGRTQGRGKDDLTHKPNRTLKDVLGLPLVSDLRERLLRV